MVLVGQVSRTIMDGADAHTQSHTHTRTHAHIHWFGFSLVVRRRYLLFEVGAHWTFCQRTLNWAVQAGSTLRTAKGFFCSNVCQAESPSAVKALGCFGRLFSSTKRVSTFMIAAGRVIHSNPDIFPGMNQVPPPQQPSPDFSRFRISGFLQVNCSCTALLRLPKKQAAKVGDVELKIDSVQFRMI